MMKRYFLALLLCAPFLVGAGPANLEEITVYKSPTCGCCNKWIEHLRANGFSVRAENVADVAPYKTLNGVPARLASCHTAKIGNYIVEGHVPAADIKRLLKERPKVLGIAVPGMPEGSPGMEGPRPERYDVLTFGADGRTSVFARHGVQRQR